MKRVSRAALMAPLVLAPLALAAAPPARAQSAPDAGRVLQQAQPAPPRPLAPSDLVLPTPEAALAAPGGGASVQLTDVTIEGADLFPAARLRDQLGPVSGRSYDLAGLRALAERVAAFYRAQGYPFTRVILPPQDLASGVLRLQVVEGRYGRVSASGDPRVARPAQPFLGALKPGAPIAAGPLERSMLILNDQPGMKVFPTVSPGAEPGSGDLVAEVRRVARFGGDAGFDNGGSRYVGPYRAKANLYAYSPFLFGDMVSLHGLYSNLGMWLGSAEYEAPVGASGLRAKVGYAQTDYQLGDAFKDLRAAGYARVVSARLSYPVVRSQARNLVLSLEVDSKTLQDRYGALGVVNDKSSLVWPLGAQFDAHDHLFGGGVTWGLVGVTVGRLNLGRDLASVDAFTAQTSGSFGKANLDISRIQTLAGPLSLLTRVSAQWASKNLDSSEKFVPGGPYGVRAFPVGEALGDRGWVVQTEARFDLGRIAPYVLFDAGGVDANRRPWDAVSDQRRTLAGAGLGARVRRGGWTVDGSVSWQVRGGPAVAEGVSRAPRVWVNTTYSF